MAVYYNSGRIITDGLVLCLDAANPKSYPGSGTTWTDLSGLGNNGTLVNGVGYTSVNRGSLSFDGVDDYTSTSALLNYTSATWCCWFNPTTTTLAGAYSRRLLHKSDGSGNNEINIHHNGGSLYWTGYGASSYSWQVSTTGIATNNWFYAVGSYDAVNAYLYLNGSLVNSAVRTVSIGNATVPLYIGRVSFNNVGIYQGNISQVSIYNRALTAQEIQQNFNATRGRYGI